jgi:hypothetical protein
MKGGLQVGGQPEQLNDTLFHNKKKKLKKAVDVAQ